MDNSLSLGLKRNSGCFLRRVEGGGKGLLPAIDKSFHGKTVQNQTQLQKPFTAADRDRPGKGMALWKPGMGTIQSQKAAIRLEGKSSKMAVVLGEF